MCKTTTTTHSCGCPPTKDWSPCEAFCKGETCTGPEEHAEEVEEPCKDCEAEAKLITESLQKIAEDENLAPVPKTSAGAGENQSPKLYYTMVIRWPRCNHISFPEQTDIERDPSDPTYIETPGQGLCHRCSEAHPSTIKTMKESGIYEQDDPWGEMTKDPKANAPMAGGSKEQESISIRARSMGLTDAELEVFDERQAKAAKAAKEEEKERERDNSPEVMGKGKGRRGDPEDTYAKKYGPVPSLSGDGDEDDDEDAIDSDPVGDKSDDELSAHPRPPRALAGGRLPPAVPASQHPALRGPVPPPPALGTGAVIDDDGDNQQYPTYPPPDWSAKPHPPSGESHLPPPPPQGPLPLRFSPRNRKLNHHEKEDDGSGSESESYIQEQRPKQQRHRKNASKKSQNPLRPGVLATNDDGNDSDSDSDSGSEDEDSESESEYSQEEYRRRVTENAKGRKAKKGR